MCPRLECEGFIRVVLSLFRGFERLIVKPITTLKVKCKDLGSVFMAEMENNIPQSEAKYLIVLFPFIQK